MTITITGATGFIGRRLIARLPIEYQLFALTRRANVKFGERAVWTAYWDPMSEEPPPETIRNTDVVVHLAGEPVAQRWTPEAKTAIRESRVQGTRRLVAALAKQQRKPSALICASAIGIYGSRGDDVVTEDAEPGEDFLAKVCREWEAEAQAAGKLGIRVACVRIGIVLGKGGGALEKMVPPFRMFVGGKLGSGRQWMSWVHLDDVVGVLMHAIDHPLSGAFNATAPNPATNAEFTRELASALGRPAIFPVPEFALKAAYGEMAGMLLVSQRVAPKATEQSGYQFQFRELPAALRDVLR
jgi:uncharacterized protein